MNEEEELFEGMYNEVVQVFGGDMPPSAQEEHASKFEELTAKAMKYAHDNGIVPVAGFVEEYAEEIKNMPDMLVDENIYMKDDSLPGTGFLGDFAEFKANTNMFVKYLIFALIALFIAILTEKFAKAIAAAGLIILGLLLFKYYSNKYNQPEQEKA
jgi:hypothetical protein